MQLVFILASLGVSLAALNKEIDFKYNTLPKEEFVEYFNKLNLTWTVKNYDFNASQLVCAHLRKSKDFPYVQHDLDNITLPVNFDSREKWPNCSSIKEIFNQQHCGSCWAFGVATTASDRTCIHAGQEVNLSEQDLDCCKKAYDITVCNGGSPADAFNCWTTIGLVSQECRPYDVTKLLKENCRQSCDNNQDYKHDKHYGDNIFQVAKDDKVIRAELFKNGPVQVGFDVYVDFLDYTGGIYEHKYGSLAGGHSVRMIGYGEENGVKYWLAANSWGKTWGEKGFFRVKRYIPELHFEDFLITGLPRRR